MLFIRPIEIGDDQFVSSTLTEDEYSDYSSGTTYTQGQRVIFAHNVYEALEGPGGSNVDHEPGTTAGADWWVKVGPTNMWAMFDSRANSQSTSASNSMTVVIAPGDFVTHLVLLDVYATSATITMRDGLGGAVVFTETVDLDETVISDWYEYYYEPYRFATQKIIEGLPLYVNGHITVELAHDSDTTCGLGGLVVGTAYYMGEVMRDSDEVGGIDYSRIETNDFGTVEIVRRDAAKTLRVSVHFPREYRERFYQLMTEARALPGVWTEPGDPLLTCYGVRKEFSIRPLSAAHYRCDFDVMGFV